MLDKAIEIAVRAHTGQLDKCGEPYILHPLRVMLSRENKLERICAPDFCRSRGFTHSL